MVFFCCGCVSCLVESIVTFFLACHLLSIDIGADSNIGGVGPSIVGGSNSMSTIAGKMSSGNDRGSNIGVGNRGSNHTGSNIVR